jgi:hypothetical protein
MRAIETTAQFDENGKIIIDKLPNIKNKKVRLLILMEEDSENDFYNLSSQSLSNAYSVHEPDYDLSLVKEPNPDYGHERK